MVETSRLSALFQLKAEVRSPAWNAKRRKRMIDEREGISFAAGPTMGAMHRYCYLWDASLTRVWTLFYRGKWW